MNNILGEDGEKTRADHRHHAVDALTVACAGAYPGITQRLSRYWQEKESGAKEPRLPPPWESIRADATKAVADIVVSHRVRKKVSGALHRETYYGNTGETEGEYSLFVARKPVEALSSRELIQIRDERVRKVIRKWVEEHGGDAKKAFPPYPKLGQKGPEIRKVRLLKKQRADLMEKAATGYADLGNNHHMAIYRYPDGKLHADVVSLFEASRRLSCRESVVRRKPKDGSIFVMSLSPGDVVELREGEERGLWVVQGVASTGRPTLSRIEDARPTSVVEARKQKVDGKRKDFEPRFKGFMRRNPRKISVDPIGRIRPAND